jgi:DNA-3-methyladenine glycosylase I
MTDTIRSRCEWCGTDPLYVAYHDNEWGIPVHDDVRLFEMLTLEGAQAGLSWSTILKKREGYRAAFHQFDIERVARMSEVEQTALRHDAGIVRNRLKIASTVTNAKAFLDVQREFGSFSAYVWRYTDEAVIQTFRGSMRDLPAETDLSKRISKDLKKRSFRFVGPTIIYAYMQAVGIVNDHIVSCFRHDELLT